MLIFATDVRCLTLVGAGAAGFLLNFCWIDVVIGSGIRKRPCDQGLLWSGRPDSNWRPSPWQGDALPLSHARKGAIISWVEDAQPRTLEGGALFQVIRWG